MADDIQKMLDAWRAEGESAGMQERFNKWKTAQPVGGPTGSGKLTDRFLNDASDKINKETASTLRQFGAGISRTPGTDWKMLDMINSAMRFSYSNNQT